MKVKITMPRSHQQRTHQVGVSMSLDKKFVGGREVRKGQELTEALGRPD